MVLKDCQIYDLKKSTLDLDLEIEEVKTEVQRATQEKQKAEAILDELTSKDGSYVKIKAKQAKPLRS